MITGEIQTPGIYRLPKGSRVFQLIQLAGGIKPGAKVSSKFLKSRIVNGSRIHIVMKKKKKGNANEVLKTRFKLNTVTLKQLISIPGIGKKTALKIIQYRNQNRGFKHRKELLKVQGIGKKRFKVIRPYLQ